MSKIICDICGTTYPDTSECCPICGFSNDSSVELPVSDYSEEVSLEEMDVNTSTAPASARKKEIFDFDEVNMEEEPEEEYSETPYETKEEWERRKKIETYLFNEFSDWDYVLFKICW